MAVSALSCRVSMPSRRHSLAESGDDFALLHRAMELTAARAGNQTRRQLLLDSRDEPWSEAERLFHRLLREAGITGWKANQPVVLKDRPATST